MIAENPLGIKDLWEIVLVYAMPHKEDSLNKEFKSLFKFCSSYENSIGSKNFIRYKSLINDVLLWRHPHRKNYDGYIWDFKTDTKTDYKLSKYYWWSIGNEKNFVARDDFLY